VEDEDLVALVPEMTKGTEYVAGVAIEVGDDDDEATTMDAFGETMEDLGDVGGTARGEVFELAEEDVEMDGGGAGRDEGADLGVEGDEADGILLADHEIGKRGGEVGAVFELGGAALGVGHGGGGVEEDVGLEVGLFLELLDVEAVGPGVGGPVEVADVVARGVFAVLGKLDGEAVIGRTVEAGDEALDDGTCDKVHALETGDRLGGEITV